MSYQSEILADNPVFYARLDDISGSAVMTDLSGFDNHGSFYSDAVFGLASPIETDASSKAIGNHVGIVEIPNESLSAFTWEAWALHDGAVAAVAITRGGQIGLGSSNFLAINSGNAHAQISIAGSGSFNLVYALPSLAWYHLVVTRNGNVARLYINGVLRVEDTTLGLGDLSGFGFSVVPTANTYIGTGQTADVFASHGMDEPAIYDYALSASRVLAHYEAALASLPLRATIVINLAVELNTDQIVPTDFGFPHNFSATFGDGNIPVTEELEYRTNVLQSEPDYQQRVSARPHGALRTLEYHLSPTSGAARARLQGELYTPGQFYCVPVWSDSGVLTAQATSGNNTLSLDTTKRDYEVGSYVGFCSDLQNPATYQFYKITAVADAQLTLDSDILTTVASGKPVFPARVASLSDDSFAVKSFAADHEDTVLRFELIESELSTRRITAYTPSTTYLSKEVFTLETAKVSFLDDRPYSIERRIQSHGRDYQFAKDTGSPQTFPVRFLLTTRAALSEFFGWLNARQGKLNPLFVSTKERDLIATARPTGTTLTVTRTGFSLHHGRRHLEITAVDGSTSRYRVTSIVSNGATETWSVDTPMPVFADIAKVSFLKYCTLAQDTIRIEYFKGGSNGAIIAQATVHLRELLTSPE
jgi:hypothetical protein